MAPSVTHEKSSRVRSSERQGSNSGESEEEAPEEDLSLIEYLLAGLFITSIWIIGGMVKIYLTILAQKRRLRVIASAPDLILKDMTGVIEEENVTWLDQYMMENGEKKPGEDDEG